jgi:hypothetical protein
MKSRSSEGLMSPPEFTQRHVTSQYDLLCEHEQTDGLVFQGCIAAVAGRFWVISRKTCPDGQQVTLEAKVRPTWWIEQHPVNTYRGAVTMKPLTSEHSPTRDLFKFAVSLCSQSTTAVQKRPSLQETWNGVASFRVVTVQSCSASN